MPLLNIIFSFTLALILHELGHMVAARTCNVPVKAIGLGWGPRFYEHNFKTFALQLRLLPLGAFVQLEMETLKQRPLPQQLFVLGGGILINLLLCVISWPSTFAALNLGLAIGNILPIYQHDGWKSLLLISRRVLGRPNQIVEWSITLLGAFAGGALVLRAIAAF